jgi:hypothetical protein
VVTVTNADTGQSRAATTDETGEFVFAQLPPGVYELSVEAQGFQNPRKTVVVQTGSTTRADVQLTVDVLQQAVEAIAYLPELRYDWHGVDGVVSRFQIENLPLNGREFLQLSILEPGVMAAPSGGFFTRQFDVSVLGSSSAQTRYTMDGSPIHNTIGRRDAAELLAGGRSGVPDPDGQLRSFDRTDRSGGRQCRDALGR